MLSKPPPSGGWIGVRLFRSKEGPGAKIGLVFSGSPAEKAGICPGDIVTHWGPQAVDSPSSLSDLVRRTRVDETVRVTLLRAENASREGVDVTITPKPLQF